MCESSLEADIQISVVIPTLNEEKVLPRLLKHFTPALKEELNLEVIISDGGSTDTTLACAYPYADQIVVHRGNAPQTIAAGRNAGAYVARGKVLFFLNADVQLPEDVYLFFKHMAEVASRQGCATCRVEVLPEEATWVDRLVLGGCNVLFSGMAWLGMGAGRGECQVVRKDIFQAVGGYREDLVAGEDFEFFGRVVRHLKKQGISRVAFVWHLCVYEDPRRYRKAGYLSTLALWAINYFSVLWRRRAYSLHWKPVR